jgi:tRNA nucleotidyltransferase (CCA-adding enzyme)
MHPYAFSSITQCGTLIAVRRGHCNRPNNHFGIAKCYTSIYKKVARKIKSKVTAYGRNVKKLTVFPGHAMIPLNPTQILLLAPPALRTIMASLHAAGHGVWVVGGAIRDHLLGTTPHDWDLASTATPDQVMRLFPRVIPLGLPHGTVQVHTPEMDVEVTSCPTELSTSLGILADLGRRDFTINAMAIGYPAGTWLDPHGGARDLAAKRVRAVGDAHARFREDPLRTLRAARLVSVWGFHVTPATLTALRREAPELSKMAWERIREEMLKLLVGPRVLEAFALLRRTGILSLVLPELLEGVRKQQNAYHRHDVYHHTLFTVHYSPARLRVRLAALLHDIAKPRVRRRLRGSFRFYGHAKAGSELAQVILKRWKMPLRLSEDIRVLTANHMLMDTDRWSDAAVRRLIARVGTELLEDLLDLADADFLAHGIDSDQPSPTQHLRQRITCQLDQQPALHVSDLALNGRDVMRALALTPGPRVGQILRSLHQKVLKQPELNQRDILLELLDQHHF